jgi:hypothetical protein
LRAERIGADGYRRRRGLRRNENQAKGDDEDEPERDEAAADK